MFAQAFVYSFLFPVLKLILSLIILTHQKQNLSLVLIFFILFVFFYFCFYFFYKVFKIKFRHLFLTYRPSAFPTLSPSLRDNGSCRLPCHHFPRMENPGLLSRYNGPGHSIVQYIHFLVFYTDVYNKIYSRSYNYISPVSLPA